MPTAYGAEFRNVSCCRCGAAGPAAPLVVRAHVVKGRTVGWPCRLLFLLHEMFGKEETAAMMVGRVPA